MNTYSLNWSRYSYFFKSDGHFFLYNSLSNSFAELESGVYNELYKMKSENVLPYNDDELLSDLKKMKAVVVNDDDEIYKVKYLAMLRRFNNKTLNLTISPTTDCNFACPYCFESEHRHSYMTDDVEKQCITFIKKHTEAKHLSVTWFGGEPLMAFKRIVSLTEKMKKLWLRYSAGIITNGFLLNRNVIERLADLSVSVIQITLDGLAEKHDSRRCLKNGGKTFDRIVNNIDLLKNLAPEVKLSIRVNIDNTNEEDFINIFQFFFKKNYPNISVYPAFVEDITDTNNCALFDSKKQASYLIRLYKKYGLDFSRFYPAPSRYECSIRNANSVVIGPEGELYKCWNDVGNKKRIIGMLDGKNTNESLLLRYLVGADPFDDPKCKECFLLPVCSGGCPYTRLQNMYEGKNFNTCDLIKNNLDEFLLLQYHKTKNSK